MLIPHTMNSIARRMATFRKTPDYAMLKIGGHYTQFASFGFGPGFFLAMSRPICWPTDLTKPSSPNGRPVFSSFRRQGKWAVRIAVFSIIFSIIAVTASIIGVCSSTQWQAEQVPVLKDIRNELSSGQLAPQEHPSTSPSTGAGHNAQDQ
jgi:hypothetical protein